MHSPYVAVILGILGLLFGSFAGAQVWRLRARQLVEDKREGESYDKKEYKQLVGLTKGTVTNDRSRCLRCGHELGARDLVPLVSWLSTGGTCRYCKQAIGYFEPLMELGTAVVFVLLYALWPYPVHSSLDVAYLVSWFVATLILVILFAYDFKWYLLPNIMNYLLVGVGVVASASYVAVTDHPAQAALSVAGGVVILSGIYALLWLISRGRWIGFGDVKLGLGLALLLADWRLAFIALFAANLIGCLAVLPGMIRGKVSRTTHVPFGPLLIAGAFVALLWGQAIIHWYVGFL